MSYPISLLFALLVCTCVRAQNIDGLTLESNEDGVQVYVRSENNGDMTVRIVTRARTQVQTVREVLNAADRYPEWVHRCDEAYAIAGGSPDSFVYVSGIDMPFPFRDKEVVARVTQYVRSDGTFVRTITSEPQAIPDDGKRDRLSVYHGEWVVTPLAGGEVELQCTVRTNAGSGLPNWLRREIMTGGPTKTMTNLRERLLDAK